MQVLTFSSPTVHSVSSLVGGKCKEAGDIFLLLTKTHHAESSTIFTCPKGFLILQPASCRKEGKELDRQVKEGTHLPGPKCIVYATSILCVYSSRRYDPSHFTNKDSETLGSLLTSFSKVTHFSSDRAKVWVPVCLALKSRCQDFSLVAHPRQSYDVARAWYWHPAPTFSFNFSVLSLNDFLYQFHLTLRSPYTATPRATITTSVTDNGNSGHHYY